LIAALCAAVSIPRASPEITTKPASARSRARRVVKVRPLAEALREPTIPTAGLLRTAALPRTQIMGGDESAACKGLG
jgi:hypothetical protein